MTDPAAVFELLIESFPTLLLSAVTMTVPLAVGGFALGSMLALALAVVRIKRVPVLSSFARLYVWLVRGTPLLVQLFVIFFGLPSLGILIDPVPAALAAFAFNVGAYGAEILRGAIESVHPGQWRAGRSLGLRERQVIAHIILPQALRSAFPALMGSFISLVKDTSLAASVTVAEMFMQAQQIAARTYEPFWLYIEAGAVYLILCTALSWLQHIGEKRLAWTTR